MSEQEPEVVPAEVAPAESEAVEPEAEVVVDPPDDAAQPHSENDDHEGDDGDGHDVQAVEYVEADPSAATQE